jgi:hypothetical protein
MPTRADLFILLNHTLCKTSNFVTLECRCADCKALRKDIRKQLKTIASQVDA